MSSNGHGGVNGGMQTAKLRGRRITLHDNCLRDGMHPKRHQISIEQMVTVAAGAILIGKTQLRIPQPYGRGVPAGRHSEAQAREGVGSPLAGHRHGRSLEDGA